MFITPLRGSINAALSGDSARLKNQQLAFDFTSLALCYELVLPEPIGLDCTQLSIYDIFPAGSTYFILSGVAFQNKAGIKKHPEECSFGFAVNRFSPICISMHSAPASEKSPSGCYFLSTHYHLSQ